MKKLATTAFVALGLLAAPTMASAATTAYANSTVSLRTGPDAGYPRVATLRAGTPLQVYGCINDWSWCDVSVGRDRGWVSAGHLDAYSRGHRVAVSRYGVGLGLPVIRFTFNSYWNDHYRYRTWYAQRNQWAGYRPPVQRIVVVKPQPRPVVVKPQVPGKGVMQHQSRQKNAPDRGNGSRKVAWRDPAGKSQQRTR
ncbi:SH3 domain-containing protein [Pseudoxanthomonas sangjuensis]|uniref:SH3 domain-containing protein n=1 Tax=Pseudoxanthomonas sangjuensis TaxID=1503750 RepID=UPI001391BCBE|nr:SH3 domain-containing protein [Pseudoxanthomonas sangjuensis]